MKHHFVKIQAFSIYIIFQEFTSLLIEELQSLSVASCTDQNITIDLLPIFQDKFVSNNLLNLPYYWLILSFNTLMINFWCHSVVAAAPISIKIIFGSDA